MAFSGSNSNQKNGVLEFKDRIVLLWWFEKCTSSWNFHKIMTVWDWPDIILQGKTRFPNMISYDLTITYARKSYESNQCAKGRFQTDSQFLRKDSFQLTKIAYMSFNFKLIFQMVYRKFAWYWHDSKLHFETSKSPCLRAIEQ